MKDARGQMEQVLIRVDRITSGTIQGRIQSAIRTIQGFQRGQAFSLREGELIDWTIVAPDGNEEGNVVGKFLDTWRPRR